MKELRSFLFLLVLILSENVQSQVNAYHPFPSSNAIWRESSGGFQCGCCEDYQYWITGDTVFNGLTYRSIGKKGKVYSEDSWGNCTGNVHHNFFYELWGYYREDSLNKKVYFKQHSSVSDTLLYDFDLSIGDTLPPTLINDPSNETNVVSSIDSILIGNDYHKRFGISLGYDSNYVDLIEGIGNSFGLMGLLVPPFERGTYLYCVTIDGETVYPDSSYDCPLLLTGIEEDYPSLRIQPKIYPNPSTGYVNIEATGSDQWMTVKLYNTLGVLIRMDQFRTSQLFQYELPEVKGMYLMQLIDGDGFEFNQNIVRD